jgi:hypothetical protein
MNTFKKLLFILALALCFSSVASAQLLTQTTLSAAVTGGGPYSGPVGTLQMSVTLASITGLQPALLGTQVQSIIYIDQEAMGVIGPIPASAALPINVIRGMFGTPASPHVSGTMVLYGQINLMGSNEFFQRDPDLGQCSTTFPQSPWINVLTSMQWLCSSITKTWVPGFGNPGKSGSPLTVTTAVASVAGATLPSGPLFHVTGTNAITSWTIPLGFNGTAFGGGCFNVIPDAVFTWTAAGNIALAGSAVVNKLLTFCWDATNSKWIPSYIA